MLKNWFLSGKGALSEFTERDIDEMRTEELTNLFDKNFENLINSWILEDEVKEFDEEKGRAVTRGTKYNSSTVISNKIFSGIISNKYHDRNLKKVSELDSDPGEIDEEVLYEKGDEPKVYLKKGIVGDYLKERILDWGSKNGKCSICENEGNVDPIKQYIFPFSIASSKFWNLRPSGRENIQICKKCAIVLFSAYSNIAYNLNGDYLNLLCIYSNDLDEFYHFKRSVMRESFSTQYNTNLKGIENYAGVKRPYEFLFTALNEMSKKPDIEKAGESESLADIKLLIAGADVSGSKTIYFSLEHLGLSSELWDFFIQMNNEYPDSARKFFLSLVPNIKDESLCIARNSFLERLFKTKEIDYQTLEEFVFTNISEEKRVVTFLRNMVLNFLRVFDKMEEKEIFDKVSKRGYAFGKQIIDEEGSRKRAKGHLYQLRRSRDLSGFLDAVNSVQTSLGLSFDQRVFLENKEDFNKLKSIFLISMANSIFGGENND